MKRTPTPHSSATVNLEDRSYPIYVGSEMARQFGDTCRRHGIPRTVALIADRTVARLHLSPLARNLRENGFAVHSIVLAPGEQTKSLGTANAIFTELLKKGLGRNSAIVAFGGGVVGDLAGFVAATFQRGVPVIQVPTTLLAQVDSSIGGKTAVNHPFGKNLIGAFHQPSFVWSDGAYLRTLPRREVISGMGEVVKYGVLAGPQIFDVLEAKLDRFLKLDEAIVRFLVRECSAFKAKLVSEDEREKGIRIILNAGHTVGHALEAATGFRALRHGEAILWGLAAEAAIAHRHGIMGDDEYRRLLKLLSRVPLRSMPAGVPVETVLEAMGHDKKRVTKSHRFVLPKTIGSVAVVENIPSALIRDVVRQIVERRFAFSV